MFPKKLDTKLQKRKSENSFRRLKIFEDDVVDFFSNDYLGIARELHQIQPKIELGGATGSRLISGNKASHEKLEKSLANFYRGQTALLFSSGYIANQGLLSAIGQRGDTIFYDEKVHASIKDGLRLSFAKTYPFKHNSPEQLSTKLEQNQGEEKYIVLESLYSMDGTVAPLQEFVDLAEKHNAYVIVDEAHATGFLGKLGRGLCLDLDSDRMFARIHTFGKALGSHGAVVVGNQKLRDYLINFSRPFIYTTALPEHAVHEIEWAHKLFVFNKVCKLREVVQDFQSMVREGNLEHRFLPSNSPIQGITGNLDYLKTIESQLNKELIGAKIIHSPTVKAGEERIRLVLHNFNTKSEIEHVLNILKKYE